MKITVNKDNVKIEEFDIVHEGEHRVNKCSFSFSEEYTEELVKKAIFTSQNSSIEVAIINNECDIPGEILKARNIVLLGVYAYKVIEDKLDLRYSPSPDAFKVNSGSYIEEASESEEITPSQFEQYMQALNDGLNKVEESIKKMDSATSAATQLVDDINQKLENGDFIGPQGPQGVQGTPGTNGADGVGITTITSGQSSVEADKTITPVTIQKSDGSSQSFKVEAKNGQDGQNGQDGKDGVNGQDGLTPSIGENGNWFIGDTDTGKPSRGEVGPSPDLSDYVKNTDYAKDGQGGVISTGNHFRVYSNNGVPYVNSINSEQYSSSGDNIFIGKGTLESIKDDYVGSSNPLITLNNTLDNLVRKNRVSDYIISLKDALKYKVFEFLVHGKTKQETMTGKNLFDYNNVVSSSHGLNVSLNENGSITVVGNPDTNYIDIVPPTNYDRILEDGETYTISQDVPGYIYLQIGIVPKDGSNTVYVTSSNSSSAKEFSFTVDKTKYTYTAEIQSGTMASLGNNVNFTAKFQLEKGSKATEFEKYTGGQSSPNPDYPQQIKTLTFDKITRCGKNLFGGLEATKSTVGIDFTTYKDGSISAIGTSTNQALSLYSADVSDYLRVLVPGTYTLSGGQNNIQVQVVQDDGTALVITPKASPYTITFTLNETKKIFVRALVENGVTVNTTIYPMLEQGSQATEYEPYQATEYAIDLQGNEMVELPNGVINKFMIDKKGNVSLIKNIGKVILDGSENNWDWNMITEDEKYRFSTGVIQSLVEPSTPCLSNYFMSGSADDCDYFVENTIEIAPSGGITICTYAVSNSIEEFRAWLQEHNVIVYYQLATPEVIPLGTLSELITTEEGINTFFINGNLETTLEVLYARDSEKYLQQYIDDKLATLSQAIIEE